MDRLQRKTKHGANIQQQYGERVSETGNIYRNTRTNRIGFHFSSFFFKYYYLLFFSCCYCCCCCCYYVLPLCVDARYVCVCVCLGLCFFFLMFLHFILCFMCCCTPMHLQFPFVGCHGGMHMHHISFMHSVHTNIFVQVYVYFSLSLYTSLFQSEETTNKCMGRSVCGFLFLSLIFSPALFLFMLLQYFDEPCVNDTKNQSIHQIPHICLAIVHYKYD